MRQQRTPSSTARLVMSSSVDNVVEIGSRRNGNLWNAATDKGTLSDSTVELAAGKSASINITDSAMGYAVLKNRSQYKPTWRSKADRSRRSPVRTSRPILHERRACEKPQRKQPRRQSASPSPPK
jgi:hypothetical protein